MRFYCHIARLKRPEKPYDTAPDSTRSESPPPRPSLFASRGTVSAKDGLGITVSVAVVSDAYGRVCVAAALVLQGNVAEERFMVPFRPSNSGHGTSAMRPDFGHAALRCV